MADYHVMFNTDNNYLFYLFVTCQTLVDSLEHTSDDGQDRILIHVLVDNEIDMPRAETYVQSFLKFNAQVPVKLSFEFHHIDASIFAGCHPMERDGKLSYTTYYRLLLAGALPEDVQRLLYLDIDLLIKDDIRKMFKQHPVDDNVFYAAPEMMYLSFVKDPYDPEAYIELHPINPQNPPYQLKTVDCIQAGVLLINVAQWRAQQVEQKCIELAKTYLTSFFDQDLLAVACKGKISHLSWEWNISLPMFYGKQMNEAMISGCYTELQKTPLMYHPTLEQVRKLETEQSIVHFAGKFKPWSLTKKLTPHEAKRYASIMVFAQAWLQAYARLAQAFKSQQ